MTRTRGEDGRATLEFVLVMPLLIVILLFVVGLGRFAYAKAQLEGIAADSARAASLERNTSRSAAAARQAAEDSLGRAGVSCTDLTVTPNLSSYEPGGQVTVTVACTARLRDVAMAGFPGTKTFTASSTVPIENWRAK